MEHTNAKRRHVKRALTCLLVATAAWIVLSLYWLAVVIQIHAVQILPDYFLINAINPVASGVATIATFIAAIHILRARICAAKYQRIAVLSVTVFSTALIAHSILNTIATFQIHSIWHQTRRISSGSLPFPASMMFSMTDWDTWLYTVPNILTELALLTLILPPALKLSNWAPSRLRVARVFAAVFLCIALAPEVLSFLEARGLSTSSGGLIMQTKLFTFHNIVNATEFLALTALLFFLIDLRKNVASLTRDPAHCDRCDYPLEPSFTTCPECGTERSGSPPPD